MLIIALDWYYLDCSVTGRVPGLRQVHTGGSLADVAARSGGGRLGEPAIQAIDLIKSNHARLHPSECMCSYRTTYTLLRQQYKFNLVQLNARMHA